MTLKERIEELVRLTDWNNKKIFEYLNGAGAMPCTKRTVRRHANPLRAQLAGGDTKPKMPKILLLDIETGPMKTYVWNLWPKYIPVSMVEEDVTVLCWSAKWLFDSQMMHQVVNPAEAIARQDASVLEGVWNLLDKADIVIAHNGQKFDTRVLNTRFLLAGMKPPLPYRMIDTLRATKQTFNLPSYKLEYINRLLNLTPKQDHEGFGLWRRCLKGSPDALGELSSYCDIDVVALEEAYLELRPWIKSHPNYALFVNTDQEICTNCGSDNLEWKGQYITPAGRYKAFRCMGCGAIGRSRFSDLTTEERKRMLLSVAR